MLRNRSRLALWSSVAALAGSSAFAYVGCAPSDATAPIVHFDNDGGGGADGAGGSQSDAPLFNDVKVEIPVNPTCTDETDTDGDNIADQLELSPATDTDADGTPDFQDDDSDGDSWLDKDEAANPLLKPGVDGQARPSTCSPLADTDGDGVPDVRDVDSDNDGIADKDERDFDADGTKNCRVLSDCDGDGFVDLVEVAAGTSPVDPASHPSDATLYFVLPCKGERTQDFDFSAAISDADIYFLIDTTDSMQPTIDNVRTSLDSTIIPTILNGDPNASPPIAPIPGARVGIGDHRDVPWAPYGSFGDQLYRNHYVINGADVWGNVSAPQGQAPSFSAPQNVQDILGVLTKGGGGDAPEGATQALWLAATGSTNYLVSGGGGPWAPEAPNCADPTYLGQACFRPDAVPVFVLISDAQFHNGPVLTKNYDTSIANGVVTYQDTIDALNAIGAKFVGVPVDTGTAGAARADMDDLATQTGSLYHTDAFGGNDLPLVTAQDTATGDVSNEVVRLIGNLSGAGLHNVTTHKSNYDCAGGVDCNGDGKPDAAYHNPVFAPGTTPYDASLLITDITTVASTASPPPYSSLDAHTFYGVKGDAQVTFRVHAENTLKPQAPTVLAAKIQVETPKGQKLGGKSGVKIVYLVLPGGNCTQ